MKAQHIINGHCYRPIKSGMLMNINMSIRAIMFGVVTKHMTIRGIVVNKVIDVINRGSLNHDEAAI